MFVKRLRFGGLGLIPKGEVDAFGPRSNRAGFFAVLFGWT
jgi:hypothetical protein